MRPLPARILASPGRFFLTTTNCFAIILTMNSKILIFLPFLVGCMGQAYYTCPTQVFGEMYSEYPVVCDRFAFDESMAFRVLADADLVPTGAQHDYNRISVHVQAKQALSVSAESPAPGTTVAGYFDPMSNTINLNNDGLSLLHEMIHVYEWQRWIIDTYNHPLWCEKKYGSPVRDLANPECPGSLEAIFEANAEILITQRDLTSP
jgi:hypothetical protein